MKVRWFRDEGGAWARATTRQRIAGLLLGLLIAGLPLVLLLVVLAVVMSRL